MDSVGTQNRCARCAELQRSFLKALEEKRTLLLRVQREQERNRTLQRELDCVKAKKSCRKVDERETIEQSNDVSSTEEESEGRDWQISEAMQANRKWKIDYDRLKLKYEEESKENKNELEKTQAKLADAETHVLALESELMRLATALSKIEENTLHATNSISQEDIEVVKQQMLVYKEDFTRERQDREKTQCEKDQLQEQLQNCQELIAALNQELDVYKEQYQRSQEENRMLTSSRRHSVPLHGSATQPQIQFVYPVVGPVQQQQQQQQWQWRQEQRRRGVFTRGPTPAPPSVFYGGDVEVDRQTPSLDMYRSY